MSRRLTTILLIPTLFLAHNSCVHQDARKPINQSKSLSVEDSVAKNRAQLAYEIELLENWVSNQEALFSQTAYGVWYHFTPQDKPSVFINSNSTATLYLNLLRLDGTPYYEPTRVENPLTDQLLPQGIRRVLEEIPVGVEATVAMPSLLAFGNSGDGQLIPSNTPLVARIFITLNSQKNNP